jgi:hypothetical protein
MLEAALEHARAGRPVVPLHHILPTGHCSCSKGAACGTPAKHPRYGKADLPDGIKSATADEEQIRKGWRRWPRANIGLATGRAAGFWVLDIDPRHGGDETLHALEREHGELPRTPEAITGGGGRHILFAYPPDFEIRSIQRSQDAPSPLGHGLDVRGEGGLIVGAGSRHQSGRAYAWDLAHHPDETAIAEAPTWLLERVKQAQGVAEGKGPAPPIPDKIPHGRQHDTLVSLAGSMRARGMVEEEIFAALWVVNENRCERPGPEANIRQIAASMMRYTPQDARRLRISATSSNGKHPEGEQDLEALFAAAQQAEGEERVAGMATLVQAMAAAGLSAVAAETWADRAKRAGLATKKAFLADLGQAVTARRQAQWTAGAAPVADYQATPEGLVWVKGTRDGIVETNLTNFTARIVEDVARDDGAEVRRVFVTEICLEGRTIRLSVPADRFDGMDWPTKELGAEAIVRPGLGLRGHASVAIKILSRPITRRTVYGHLGWRRLPSGWVYLHAGGAIGPGGVLPAVEVDLSGSLTHFELPQPPEGEALRRALRASLDLRELGYAGQKARAEWITVPARNLVYRAAVGGSDFSLHLAGPTGVFKSELAALIQQHWGPEMHARRLPASWSSTDNALEAMAFAAKDAILVIDDFCPTGTQADVQRLHSKADRVLRAQGNNSGRQRMRADGTLRPVRPPRGVILSSGEDTPRGQSLRSRMLVLDVGPGDLGPTDTSQPWPELTEAQRLAEDGVYAAAVGGFVRFVSFRYDTIHQLLRAELSRLREAAAASRMHRRTPAIVAELALGLECFLACCVDAGAMTLAEAEAEWAASWLAIGQAAARQALQQAAGEPARRFLELLAAANASGEAHVANLHGDPPETPQAWGWRQVEIGTGENHRAEWRPQGKRVGWVEGEHLYLEAEAAFAAAQRLGRDSGEPLTIGAKTLNKRLHEHGLLQSTEPARGTLTVRKEAEGKTQKVLHLRPSALVTHGETDKSDKPDSSPAAPARVPPLMSVFWCQILADPATKTDIGEGPETDSNRCSHAGEGAAGQSRCQKCQICQVPPTGDGQGAVTPAAIDDLAEADREPWEVGAA